MSNIASTSREAYHAIREDGTLSRQQQAIVDAIEVGRNYSLRELSRVTGLEINAVSGRCNDLRRMGVLELGPVRACAISGRNIHPVRLTAAPGSQEALFS